MTLKMKYILPKAILTEGVEIRMVLSNIYFVINFTINLPSRSTILCWNYDCICFKTRYLIHLCVLHNNKSGTKIGCVEIGFFYHIRHTL